ncbi:MAG TPA: hypothetical protein PLO23_05360 [Alphaproteobacteria bacterium]|nr:hypothetical protein [Alphaproteobacteria bacterium]
MKEGLGLILFLVALPALIALGHDIYLFYLVNEELANDMDFAALSALYAEDTPGRGFNFASFGFLWTHYAPDHFREFQASLDQADWDAIRPYLRWEAFPTFGIFAAVIYVLVALKSLFDRMKIKKIRNY